MKHLKLRKRTADDDSGSYILASNVYASAGKWCNKAEVRELMNRRGLTKPPGCSRIEVDGTVCEFSMGDYNHPEAEKIYNKLDQIVDEIRKEGYNPRVSEVLLEMDDEDKAIQLLHHSEKLALAYGLIRNRQGSEIRIVKNLRSCEDCHEFMKLVSKIYQREIIVRDRIRFHHFKNGDCSCKDYWREVGLGTFGSDRTIFSEKIFFAAFLLTSTSVSLCCLASLGCIWWMIGFIELASPLACLIRFHDFFLPMGVEFLDLMMLEFIELVSPLDA
ncbi:hypothetical protein AHAS_Ahas18G0218200 [Arachis hypogaea]